MDRSEHVEILIPQLGVNDVQAQLVDWTVAENAPVQKDETVCAIETTKTVADVEAPANGYLVIFAAAGEMVDVGSVVGLICPSPVTPGDKERLRQELHERRSAARPPASQWTHKAKLLADKLNLPIEDIPASGDKITEADVHAYVKNTRIERLVPSKVDTVYDHYARSGPQRLLILGGGDGAVQVADVLAKVNHQVPTAIMDDAAELQGKKVAGVPVVGKISAAHARQLIDAGEITGAVIAISTSVSVRKRLYEEFAAEGLPFHNVVHPSAVVGEFADLGSGNVILAFCHIGPCAQLGNNNFLSVYCSIEHHSRLGSHCSFGPTVVSSSSVFIGDEVRFGTGIYIEPFVKVGSRSVIASGCVLRADVPDDSMLKLHHNYSFRSKAQKSTSEHGE